MADATFDKLNGKWEIDPAHSKLAFSVKHMMVSTVRGHFKEFSGGFVVPEEPSNTEARVTIKTSSIDTGNEDRDNHLRTNDFFAIEEHPEIRFEAADVEVISGDKARVAGDLTVRGVTRPVTLDVVLEGYTPKTVVNREDFGLTWNKPLEGGGVLIGKDVKLALHLAAVKVDA